MCALRPTLSEKELRMEARGAGPPSMCHHNTTHDKHRTPPKATSQPCLPQTTLTTPACLRCKCKVFRTRPLVGAIFSGSHFLNNGFRLQRHINDPALQTREDRGRRCDTTSQVEQEEYAWELKGEVETVSQPKLRWSRPRKERCKQGRVCLLIPTC